MSLPPIGALRFEEQAAEDEKHGDARADQAASASTSASDRPPPRHRRAVASRPAKTGSLLLPAPLLPFEAVLDSEEALSRRCSRTFMPAKQEEGRRRPLLRCSGCKVARYSSADAQRRDWGGGKNGGTTGLHSRECAALRALSSSSSSPSSAAEKAKVPPASVRLVARVFWKRAALLRAEAESSDAGGKGNEGALSSSSSFWRSPDAVSALRHHFSDLPDERKISIAAAAQAARHYMRGALTAEEEEQVRRMIQDEEEGKGEERDDDGVDLRLLRLLFPPPREVATALATLLCNAHALSDSFSAEGDLRSYGVGLYPAAAMLNHSCWPSAAVVFAPGSKNEGGAGGDESEEEDGRRLEARALRDLEEGEEATISYVDLCAPRPERRKALLEGYSFDIDGGGERSDDSRVVSRWQGKVAFPPDSASSHLVSATAHESRPRAAREGGDIAERRSPLEAVVVFSSSGGETARGSGGLCWVEEEAEEEGAEEGESKNGKRKTVKVLAWGPAFSSEAALASYSRRSASAALAAALSSEALSRGDSRESLSLAEAGRRALGPWPSSPVAPAESSYVSARLDEATTHAAVSRSEFGAALAAARRAVANLHLLCAPRGHPPRALALATLAKLEAHALSEEEAKSSAGETEGIEDEAKTTTRRLCRAAAAAEAAAREIGVCFPGSDREKEFAGLAQGLKAEAAAVAASAMRV